MFIASSNPQVLYGASFLTFTGARTLSSHSYRFVVFEADPRLPLSVPCGPFFLAWATANAGNPVARAVTSAIVPAFGSWGSMVFVEFPHSTLPFDLLTLRLASPSEFRLASSSDLS